TGRKLAPALYNLGREGMLPPNFACVGFARREKTHQQFRDEIKEDISTYSRTKPIEDSFWDHFHEQFFYNHS
ncbi:MAG TPA: glucose-6-phosphate dehydrogenase, partial [Parachlamydiales bacterium]|nr:glucose-6-phosphate dehydrogenase [Parachlamydiales bacterium]